MRCRAPVTGGRLLLEALKILADSLLLLDFRLMLEPLTLADNFFKLLSFTS